jgi:hypothetical protein
MLRLMTDAGIKSKHCAALQFVLPFTLLPLKFQESQAEIRKELDIWRAGS